MMIKRIIFLLLALFGFAHGITDYLSFVKNESLFPSSVYEFMGETDTIYYDATFESNAVIKIMKTYSKVLPSLQVSCLVNELNPSFQILDALVYYQKENSPPTSKMLNQYLSKKPRSDRFDSDVEFSVYGNLQEGFVVKFVFNNNKRPLNGKFWCSLRSSKGTLKSNTFEMQDIDHYQNYMVGRLSHKQLKDISPSNFPLTLKCSDDAPNKVPDYAMNYKPDIHWRMCDIIPGSKCYSRENEDVSLFFDHFIEANGNLVLLSMKKNISEFGFFCSKDSSTVFNYYTGYNGLGINYINIHEKVTFETITEPKTTVRIPEGTYKTPYTIYVKYRLGKTLSWSRENGNLNHFPNQTYYSLEFPLAVTKDLEDIYHLGSNNEFVIDVKIVAFPVTVKSPPLRICVFEDQSAEITAKFDNAKSYKYLINGVDHDQYTTTYTQLTFLSPSFEAGPVVKYRVNKFTSSDQSHTVSIVAANEYGSVFTNTLIRVFPVPNLDNVLMNSECIDNCLSTNEHVVTCKFDLEPYKDIVSKVAWFVESMNLTNNEVSDERANYLRADGNLLHISPIGNNTRMRKLLSKSEIYCRLQLIYSHQIDSYFEDRVIYDSEPYKKNLKVAFFHNEKIAKTLNSEMTWIASVVTAIAIILVIALLIVWYCTRNRGETYFVNAYEKAIGNDPEKEFRDVSAFQIYERPDTIPLTGAGFNQSNFEENDLDINSQDDFLECDYSDEIMTKFNETGSFINGLYGNRTIPKKNIDELLESRNKNV